MFEEIIQLVDSAIDKTIYFTNDEKIKYLAPIFEDLYAYLRANPIDKEKSYQVVRLENKVEGLHIYPERIDSSFIPLNECIEEMRIQLEKSENVSITKDNLARLCIIASHIVSSICIERDIAWQPIYLNQMFRLNVEHAATLISFGEDLEDNYIVDITYQQFFALMNNLTQRYIKLSNGYIGPSIYHYIDCQDEFDAAQSIITNGFISCDSNAFKLYCDGFIKAFGSPDQIKSSGEDYFKIIAPKVKTAHLQQQKINSFMKI